MIFAKTCIIDEHLLAERESWKGNNYYEDWIKVLARATEGEISWKEYYNWSRIYCTTGITARSRRLQVDLMMARLIQDRLDWKAADDEKDDK
jgi:hypothetical protein